MLSLLLSIICFVGNRGWQEVDAAAAIVTRVGDLERFVVERS